MILHRLGVKKLSPHSIFEISKFLASSASGAAHFCDFSIKFFAEIIRKTKKSINFALCEYSG